MNYLLNLLANAYHRLTRSSRHHAPSQQKTEHSSSKGKNPMTPLYTQSTEPTDPNNLEKTKDDFIYGYAYDNQKCRLQNLDVEKITPTNEENRSTLQP